MPPVPLKLNNLQKRFGREQALAGADMYVRPGEFLTLLGPEGCGKTTLMHIVSGHAKPDFGRVLLNGRDVTGLPPGRRDMHAVFCDTPLFPHRSVLGNIACSLKLHGVPRRDRQERARRMLALAGLSGEGKTLPRFLSPFAYKMAVVVRALASGPRVLLLDDPFARLDTGDRRRILAFVKALQQQWQFTVVYATRDREEAMAVSHRLAVMKGGRVEQLGSPEEIYLQPISAATATFLGPANLLPCAVTAKRPDGLVALEMDGLTVQAKAYGPAPAIKEDMLLCIRPEQVQIFAKPRPDSLMSGIFSGIRAEGGGRLAVVTLPTGRELLCQAEQAESLKQGSLVFVWWDTAKAALLSAEEETLPAAGGEPAAPREVPICAP